jgi:hypothetical protein
MFSKIVKFAGVRVPQVRVRSLDANLGVSSGTFFTS